MKNAVDHIAIAVWDTDQSIPYYVDTLGYELLHDEIIPGVRLTYFNAGNTMIQLVQPLEDGPIKDFLIEHGEGLHHLCFAVPDIPMELERLGIDPKPEVKMGGRGRRCAFLHNQSNGLRIELTEIEPYEEKRAKEDACESTSR